MTDKKSAISTAVQNPLSIALIIFTLVIAFIWMDYRSILKEQSAQNPSLGDMSGSAGPGGFKMAPPDLSRSGAGQPKIMDSLGGGESAAAPGLDGLIAGLEEKVKSDPSNVGKRILLAQTYKELGMLDKSITSLRQLNKEFPKHDRIKLVITSILSHRSDEKELKEALTILDDLSKSKSDEVKQYLVQMYQGDALVRLKQPKKALEKWNLALKSMPNQDNRYQILEKRIADLNSPKNTKEGADPAKKG